jgi:CRP-like cAMP-binding protein
LTFFKHYREVEHRDGSRETKWAAMQKSIYSLPALRELLRAANRRYLEFLSALKDPRNGRNKLDKLSQSVRQQGRSYPGFNFFDASDDALLRAIVRGEFNVSGMQNKTLRRFLSGKTSGHVSRLLKRLRLHGLIRKVGRTYKYYLTQFGKQVITTGLKLRELVVIPRPACANAA